MSRLRKTPEEKAATAKARWARGNAKRREYHKKALREWREKTKRDNPLKWREIIANGNKIRAVWSKTPTGRAAGIALKQRRRARLRDARSPGVTPEQWQEICAKFQNAEGETCCAYCGKACAATIDHVVPIARGGRDEPDNVLPACGSCNSSKSNWLISEWPRASALLHESLLSLLREHTEAHIDKNEKENVSNNARGGRDTWIHDERSTLMAQEE